MTSKMVFLKLIIGLILFHLCTINVSAQIINGSFESKFKRYKKNESFAGSQTQNWDAVAWKGDRIHKQILLWSKSDVNDLTYHISNLVKGADQIRSSYIKLRFGQYIKGDPKAKSCAEYPTHPETVEIIDALSDIQINKLSAEDPLKLWLTIDVPANTPVGNYTGTVTVNGGTSPLVFTIQIKVVDYTLPDVVNWNFHLNLWQFPVNILNHYNTANPGKPITIWSDEHFDLLEPGYRILADMGQASVTAQIKDDALGMPSMIKWTKKNNGTWEYDFTAFDKYVTTLMSWGINKQIDCFSPVGWNEELIPYWDEKTGTTKNINAPLNSSVYRTRWSHFLTAFKTHLDSKAWFNKTVLYLDEVVQSKLDNVFTMIQANNNAWKIGIAHTRVLSTSNSSKLYDASGILGSTSTSGRSGKITTFYTSCTQVRPNSYVTPETSLAEMTWMGWHASKENLNGYLRWAFDNWKLSDPFDARDGAHTAGDFSMIYRASNNSPSKYLPSLRLMMLREGIQDFEKIKIIKEALTDSSNPYDQEILAELNRKINRFEDTSGGLAETLVVEGQKALEAIVLGEFSYCKVNGGTKTDFYIKSITTSGGTENINYTNHQYPDTGYEHHKASQLSVIPGSNFELNIVNSDASNCARTKVWIDWNNDEDFEDAGEQMFSKGDLSCSNDISYTVSLSVPSDISQGIKRMRIQVREANEGEPQACGALEKSGTVDVDIEVVITDLYCKVGGGSHQDYYVAGLLTKGGVGANINFMGNGFPSNGYEHHADTKLMIQTGNTFTINLENSTTSNCARAGIWVDWNNDKDFDDNGEHVYNGDIAKSCNNTTSKKIPVQVPTDAVAGTTRMRVRLRDAWLDEPKPCGTMNFTGAADFDIEISTLTSIDNDRTDISSPEKVRIYPNPIEDRELTIEMPEVNNQKVSICFFTITGKLISEYNFEAFQSPEIIKPKLVKGIYLLTITGQSKIYTYKLLKL